MRSTEWVVDASFCGALVLPDEASDEASSLLAEARAGRCVFSTCALWRYEMANMLVSAVLRRRLPAAAIPSAWALLDALPLRILDAASEPPPLSIATTALEYRLTAYDAAYLALARARRAGVASLDTDLNRAATKAGLPVWRA